MEVIVLAGGLGTRLKDVVSEVPKCMAPIGTNNPKPFLEYLLDYLSRFSVSKVVLSVGYLRSVIMEWVFANQSKYPFQIEFAVESHPLGTGGAIRLALSQCHDDSVVVVNGDTFYNVDLNALYKQHKKFDLSSRVTMALKPMKNFDRYGAVTLESSYLVTSFGEKKPCSYGLINGGVYILDRGVLKMMNELPEKFSFEKDILEHHAASGQVFGYVHDNWFIDIGIPEDYARAQYCLPELVQNMLIASDLYPGKDTLMLDRDGVINRQVVGGYVTSWDKFEFMPGIFEAIAMFSQKFKHIFVVTNQRCVGKGILSQQELDFIHARMKTEIEMRGGKIDRIICCTSTDDKDPYRKPNAGMFHELCYYCPDVRPERTIMIGDSDTDVEFAVNCGIDSIKVKKFQ